MAEHIEFAPTTEHNRIYDWQPHIDRLGLKGHLKTIVGLEHTGSGQHFNSFPLRSFPYQQDGGTPPWQYDPRLNAIVLRNAFGGGADRWVQINHPGVGIVFNDRNQDQIADGGYAGFEDLIDAGEFWSDQILNPSPLSSGSVEVGPSKGRIEPLDGCNFSTRGAMSGAWPSVTPTGYSPVRPGIGGPTFPAPPTGPAGSITGKSSAIPRPAA